MDKELYLEYKNSIDMPCGLIGYVYKENNIIQLGATVAIHFSDEDESNIKILSDVENKLPEFMFWTRSKECDEFLKKNKKTIAESFYRTFANVSFE